MDTLLIKGRTIHSKYGRLALTECHPTEFIVTEGANIEISTGL
jgi:hypothetical protein